MAAYAAVNSLKYIIDQLQHHPSPPIYLQNQQVQSLTEKVNLLQEFLEGYSSPFAYSDEADPLEIRIADAAYTAEDVIESYIVDTVHHDIDLQRVIEEMDLITKEAAGVTVAEKKAAVEPQLQRNAPSHDERKSEIVGFEDELLQLKKRLVGGDLNRQIIPIVGMGGIGKTTLAQNMFDDQYIKECFRIRLWVTISQDCDIKKTLREVLSQIKNEDPGDRKNVGELGDEIYRYLSIRKFLVVMDDMWSIEQWDKMKHFFQSHERYGSRIIVTTRMSNLADHLLLSSSSNSLCMSFLNTVDSWTLFSNIVFGIGNKGYDPGLREIGEKIVGKCKGLPLSIVVIGGLLAKSERTQGYWEYIEGNLSSIVNSENKEFCLRVLKLSYNHLPAYLKPCFLYMGVFDEDRMISVSMLIKLWISEGFLKTGENKSLRTIAKSCLQELVDRNLILVHEVRSLGNVKYLKIHDLLRDLSLKEALKQKFHYVLKERSPHFIDSQRRIVIPGNTSMERVRDALESPMPRARSYVCHNHRVRRLPDSRLLRTLNAFDPIPMEAEGYSLQQVFQFVNSRHLVLGVLERNPQIPSSINMLWNLHTLIVHSWTHLTAPVEIWKMHQLEHVEFTSISGSLHLPRPPPSGDDDMIIMKNLHTLKGVRDFDLNEDTVKRIPNIKKLEIYCHEYLIERVSCLRHLGCLRQLENLEIFIMHACFKYMHEIRFPKSLKKFTLVAPIGSNLELGDMLLQEVGSLPLLQKLELKQVAFRSPTWETVEGQFPSLRSLKLNMCDGLKKWTVSDCFPLLRELSLVSARELEEIPLEIGERGTLRSMSLVFCCESVVESAKKILEEEEESNGEQSNLHVRVECLNKSEAEAVQYLASPNFHIRVWSKASSSSWPPSKF